MKMDFKIIILNACMYILIDVDTCYFMTIMESTIYINRKPVGGRFIVTNDTNYL